MVDGLAREEAEGRVDVAYATDVPSHHRGVQVFHGEQGGHSAQRFWNRFRIKICGGQVCVG